MGILDAALSTCWAMTESGLSALQAIYTLALARGGNVDFAALQAIMKENADLGEYLHMNTLESLSSAGQKGIQLEGTRYVNVLPNGIALLNMIGPIYPRANMMTMSGGMSIQQYVSDFAKAYENPNIIGIIQRIDSPGGDVRGIGDGARMIRTIMGKNAKPVESFAEGYMASAAYYEGATGEVIHGSESSMTGSIGVVLTGQKNPDDTIEIVSSISPDKRPDPFKPEGRAVLQTQVDDLAGVFVKDVARMRGVDKGKVLDDYGKGAVMFGPRAQKAGLLDNVTTLDKVVNAMYKSRTNKSVTVGKAAGWSAETIMSFAALEDDETIDLSASIVSGMTEEIANMGFLDTMKRLTQSAKADDKTVEQSDKEATEEGKESQPAASVTDAVEGAAAALPLTPAQLAAKRVELMDAAADEGELFAARLAIGHKIYPYQQNQACLDFCNAKADDSLFGGKVQFTNEKGELLEGTREEAIAARYNNQMPHTLTSPAIAATQDKSVMASIEKPVVLEEHDDEKLVVEKVNVSPERINALLEASAGGQAVLAAKQEEALKANGNK